MRFIKWLLFTGLIACNWYVAINGFPLPQAASFNPKDPLHLFLGASCVFWLGTVVVGSFDAIGALLTGNAFVDMEKKGQARPGRAVRGLTLLIGIFAIAAAAIFVKENKPASVGEAIAMLKFGNYQLTFENIQQLDLAEIASEGSAQLVGVAVPADIIRQVLPTTEHKVVLGRLVSHGDVMGIYNYPYYLLLTTASVPETERFVIRHGKTHGYILVDHSGGVRFEPYRVRDPNWSSPNPVDYALAVEVMQWDEEWKAGGSRSTARELYSRTQQD